MKKFSLFLIAALLLFSVCACTGTPSSGGTGGRGERIDIIIDERGFGTQWLDDMAALYKAETGVTVKVSKSYLQDEIVLLLDSGTLNADILMTVTAKLFDYQDRAMLEDLSDIYDATPAGESEPIKSKMNPAVYEKLLADDGKIYQMNWSDPVCSLVYNKSVLDETFGEDGYTLPRTTDELLDFAKQIKEHGVYPFTFSTQVPYLSYAYQCWWAQYEGLKSYNDYFQGYYYDNNGVRTLAEQGEVMDSAGRSKALTVASELWSKSAGLSHDYASAMTYTEAQIAFLSQGYKGQDMKKCAFMVNGDWLENEMAMYLAYQWQDIRLMRMPMISSITEKLENTDLSELTLRELISAIDEGEESFEGVSQNDFNRVRDARKMVYSATVDHPIAIPKSSKKKDMAKQFLTFLASDRAQQLYAKQLNGLTQVYGYQPENSVLSPFAKSRRELFGYDYTPVINDYSSPMAYQAGFNAFYGNVEQSLYAGDTVATIMAATKNVYMQTWPSIIALAR